MAATLHKNLVVLARVLERLERSAVRVDAEQYRTVVKHLARELLSAPCDMSLEALLDGWPAAAELYENLNYQHAGLCRSPLALTLPAEVDARSVIGAARGAKPQAKPATGS